MDQANNNSAGVLLSARRITRRLLAIGRNRVELLTLECREEREKIFRAFLLALGILAFGLLAGIALTIALVIVMWRYSPALALLILAVVYASVAGLFYARLAAMQRDWQVFPATFDELRKDCECLDQTLK